MGSGGNFFENAGHAINRSLGFETSADQYGINIDNSAFNPNAQEQSFTQQLIDRSQGKTPSVAEMQMMAGLQNAQSQAMGTAAAQRGVNPALAARLAQMQQGQMAQQTNHQQGILRAQEQMANDQLLGQSLQSQRQGRMAMQNAKLGQSYQNMAAGENATDRFSKSLVEGGKAAVSAFADGGIVPQVLMPNMLPQMQQGDMSASNLFAQALMQNTPNIRQQFLQRNSQQGDPNEDPNMLSKRFGSFLSQRLGGEKVMAGGPMDAGGITSQGINPATMESAATLVASQGAVVPGKAVAKGDSQENDKVPAMLSPGEIVVPRSVAEMSEKDIAKFVKALKARG